MLFAILQKYDFSSKSQLSSSGSKIVKVLFAILQKYDFSSKSQLLWWNGIVNACCLRYCKSTIFQANHNVLSAWLSNHLVVCDTAKVRFFKQITTDDRSCLDLVWLFAILQKYDFSSKSQPWFDLVLGYHSCLRYCKSTIFQANHNVFPRNIILYAVVCDTAKVRFFKQITTAGNVNLFRLLLFAILQKYDFSSKSQLFLICLKSLASCLRYCKSTIFQANHNYWGM